MAIPDYHVPLRAGAKAPLIVVHLPFGDYHIFVEATKYQLVDNALLLPTIAIPIVTAHPEKYPPPNSDLWRFEPKGFTFTNVGTCRPLDVHPSEGAAQLGGALGPRQYHAHQILGTEYYLLQSAHSELFLHAKPEEGSGVDYVLIAKATPFRLVHDEPSRNDLR
jgi:hypothetical protein